MYDPFHPQWAKIIIYVYSYDTVKDTILFMMVVELIAVAARGDLT